MLDWFHRLPDILILVIVVAVLSSIAFLSPFAGRRILRLAPDAARDDAVFDAFKAVMGMAGVVLAFSLVQADGNLRTAQAEVGRESSAILTVDRVLLRMGLPDSEKDRALLAQFARSQLNDEWPLLVKGGRSAVTDARYTALSQALRVIEPTTRRQEIIYGELIKGLDEISDERETLIQDSTARLPDFFWVVAISFVLLGLVLGALAEASIPRALALSSTAAGIGLLMAFVAIVDQPFQGQTSVKPAPIQKALLLNARRR